jgi:2-methylcitrate dehydratase PrpD
VYGRVGVETFLPDRLNDPAVKALMPRIAMRVNSAFDNGAPPLTQTRVTMALRDGRVLVERADGARGYPVQPASDEELDAKFLGCARGVISAASAERALAMLRGFEALTDVRALTSALSA